MFLLRSSWCDHIGNTTLAFLTALVINLISVPISAWFYWQSAQDMGFSYEGQLLIEAVMLVAILLLVYLMALCRLRVQQFPVIYAGITYSGLMIALILLVVEGGLSVYDASLYGQSVPMLAHALLLAALLWMLLLTSFVFKTALKIGAAASVMMTAMLFFVAISGRYILGMIGLYF